MAMNQKKPKLPQKKGFCILYYADIKDYDIGIYFVFICKYLKILS